MPRKSPSRKDAVYRVTFGVTREERQIIRAVADLLGLGVGELLYTWAKPHIKHHAEDPSVRDWILSYDSKESEPLVKEELTKEEALEIMEGKKGPGWFEGKKKI